MDEVQYGTVTGDDSPEVTAHACDYCGVFEVDPLSGIEAVPGESLDVIMKYRGSRVLHGSRNRCEFFNWAVKGLSKAQKSSEDGPPLSSDDSDGWMLCVGLWGSQMEGTFKMKYADVRWDFLGGIRYFIANMEVLARPGTLLILQNNVMFLTSTQAILLLYSCSEDPYIATWVPAKRLHGQMHDSWSVVILIQSAEGQKDHYYP